MEIPVVALTQPLLGDAPLAVPAAESSNDLLARTRRDIGCADCGFGAVVVRQPDRCPMCGGTNWHELSTSQGTGT